MVIGRLDQARDRFIGDDDLLGAFQRATGADVSTCRSTLAKFGLGAEHVLRPARTLSPGERTRAVLALFTASGVNCLVLDEPTNHLDLPAIEQLEQALASFTGTVLLVTHDRALLEAVTTTRSPSTGRIITDRPTSTGVRLRGRSDRRTVARSSAAGCRGPAGCERGTTVMLPNMPYARCPGRWHAYKNSPTSSNL